MKDNQLSWKIVTIICVLMLTASLTFSPFAVGGQEQNIEAKVYNSVSESVPTNTQYFLSFDTELYDTCNIHNPDDNTKLTAPVDGIYDIKGNVRFDSDTNGFRVVAIWWQGWLHIAAESAQMRSPDGNYYVSISTDYPLRAGEYVNLEVYQTSGHNLDIVKNGNWSPSFSMHKIGDLP